MSNYERIKAVVVTSTIPDTDKEFIINLFAEVSDENLPEIAALFENKPEWVAIFNDNRKKKLQAAQTGNDAAWQKILEEEKIILNKLAYDAD